MIFFFLNHNMKQQVIKLIFPKKFSFNLKNRLILTNQERYKTYLSWGLKTPLIPYILKHKSYQIYQKQSLN